MTIKIQTKKVKMFQELQASIQSKFQTTKKQILKETIKITEEGEEVEILTETVEEVNIMTITVILVIERKYYGMITMMIITDITAKILRKIETVTNTNHHEDGKRERKFHETPEMKQHTIVLASDMDVEVELELIEPSSESY